MGEDGEVRHAFMMAYDREALYYKERTKAQFYKRLGDGRMYVHHLTPGSESVTASTVLCESLGLIRRVDRLIAKLPSPRPPGFRIRIMGGVCASESYPDGEKDWLGYVPNTCHKLLVVRPDVACIAHESVREMISRADKKRHGFVFDLVTEQRRVPDGVDREDVESLYGVTQRRPRPVLGNRRTSTNSPT
jgi:hypothetical protein